MIDPLLTDHETDLVIELLEAESTKLMRETRHTDSRQMREEMQERLRTCDRLVERFRQVKAGETTA
jgi:hypothetical protein